MEARLRAPSPTAAGRAPPPQHPPEELSSQWVQLLPRATAVRGEGLCRQTTGTTSYFGACALNVQVACSAFGYSPATASIAVVTDGGRNASLAVRKKMTVCVYRG